MAKQSGRRSFFRAPQVSVEKSATQCIEMTDLGLCEIPAQFLLKDGRTRNPESQIARLATQFIHDNRGILHDFGVSVEIRYDGQKISLLFSSTNCIGAAPLLSPTSGRVDYGLIIKPRFDWSGLGPMLSSMGWKIVPTPLRLPLVPGTERKIPPWVLSSITLYRIQLMLDQLNRNFSFIEADLSAPKGSVNWNQYATRRLPTLRLLNIPCKYPSLQDNDDLKSGIHHTLKLIMASLQSQRTAGIFVLQLVELCQYLISRVNSVLPKQPTSISMQRWNTIPIRTEAFREGLRAIEWTIEERGLAGLSNLQGLPWIMPMEHFFEAWIETVAGDIVRNIGGQVKAGRKRETITPISWDPPFTGSQKYLLPDVIIERENDIIILDAKYKQHWEEINFHTWSRVEEVIREQHREDLLQILAYSTLSDKRNITSCLVYPCQETTWRSMISRNRIFHKASLYAGNRKINLLLTAVPMTTDKTEAIKFLSEALRN
ncbi:MAG TPA: hypothetical protein PLS58_01430 [Bacteroidales bacterium]|nr:hypothetical protein [Bacteroidales bacterium]